MAIIIEAPNEIYTLENSNNIKIFLAGGISNCPDWQSYLISEIRDIQNITIYNPRRKKFSINNPLEAEAQIVWEFNHLRDANLIIFWFSRGSDNPIVLYELGLWCNSGDRPAIIGIDPEYSRKQDVLIQTQLARPGQIIFESIQDIIDNVKSIFEQKPDIYEDEDDED